MKKYYYPKKLTNLFPFLQNLCAKAPNYLVQLGITGPQLSFINLMCAMCEKLNDFHNRAQKFAEDWTSLRQACLVSAATGGAPAWPVWTGPASAPVGLEAGCAVKLRAIIALWKKTPGYTAAIGEDLGIEGVEVSETTVNPETVQPELNVNVVAGQPQLSTPDLLGFDALEVEVNRGAGFAMLNAITDSPITDNHPLPAAGESDVWTYRGVLRKGNVRVGQWSLNVPVPVVGI